MRKYLFPMISSLFIGLFLAFFVIKQYENLDGLAVSSNAKELYYIQRGVYSDLENMKNNMKDFEYYIYNTEDNMFYTYIGITQDKDNALKIQNYYKSLGYDTYIKQKITDNQNFVSLLSKYDEILKGTNDNDSIKTICNQVINRYEEMVNNKN